MVISKRAENMDSNLSVFCPDWLVACWIGRNSTYWKAVSISFLSSVWQSILVLHLFYCNDDVSSFFSKDA